MRQAYMNFFTRTRSDSLQIRKASNYEQAYHLFHWFSEGLLPHELRLAEMLRALNLIESRDPPVNRDILHPYNKNPALFSKAGLIQSMLFRHMDLNPACISIDPADANAGPHRPESRVRG